MSDLLGIPLEELPFFVLAFVAGLTVHEFAHAWTAWKLGDDTAYREGRVTLNPFAHLSWIGILFFLIAHFGWAKPVPVRRSQFRRPRLMTMLVTAAGPASNLALAFLGVLAVHLLNAAGVHMSQAGYETFYTFLDYWLYYNMVLFLFNLIPLPPLDGYRIVEEFMPLHVRIKAMQYEQWSTFIFLLIVFIPPLSAVTIGPLFSLIRPIILGMDSLLGRLFG
jgi:Zn-dependent protease